jgi:hypothetical protein
LSQPVVAADQEAHLAAVQRVCGEIEALAGAARSGPPPAETVSYAFGFWGDAQGAFRDLIGTVRRLLEDLKPTATIRTALDGEAATTVVTYQSLAASAWSANPSADLAATQLRSVQRVLALRSAMARAVVAAGSVMLALSASVANPLALPHAVATARSLQEALQRLATAAEAAA